MCGAPEGPSRLCFCDGQIPESLGLAPGVVFLVCIVLFQQLHYFDIAAAVRWAVGGAGSDGSGGRADLYSAGSATDAWMVDYNAALATICFMLFLGAIETSATSERL